MREIVAFCEDSFHEKFCEALLRRLAREYRVPVRLEFRSARGGLPKVHHEFRQFLRDLSRERAAPPDAVVAVADANCRGHGERRGLLHDAFQHHPGFEQLAVYGIPDPHIERWMLVDPEAFRRVFGIGCTLPGPECAKDRYKRLLHDKIRNSGTEPLLGGQEYAEDLVDAMDLARAENEPSLRLFLRDLRGHFRRWRN